MGKKFRKGVKLMKFCWTTLMVENLEDSIEFYSEVIGLKIQRKISQGANVEICFLGEGETKIELICDQEYASDSPGQGISIGFETESLDEFLGFLKEEEILVHSGPFSPNPNIKFLEILDPSGYRVQIVEKK